MRACAVPARGACVPGQPGECLQASGLCRKDINPVVVDGEAICRIAEERCTISVHGVLVKGKLRPRHTSSITVLVARIERRPLDFRCGGAWFAERTSGLSRQVSWNPRPERRDLLHQTSLLASTAEPCHVLQNPHRQPRRDRLPRDLAPRGGWGSRRWRSIPTPMRARPMSWMADEAVRIGPAPASKATSSPRRSSPRARRPGPRRCIRAMASCPSAPASSRRWRRRGSPSSARRANAIAAMGDKIESKKLALAAGSTSSPAVVGEIDDTEHAVRIAGRDRLPGDDEGQRGRRRQGMRLAWSEQDVREGFESDQARRAQHSFGDDRVFIEKFIESPRHIEIQVIGDKHGDVLHLNERECSIQRRHQKVVEEAPSPFVTPEMRARMGAQAVALAQAVGYHSARHGRTDRHRRRPDGRELLLPRNEHPPAGRASGDRGDHRDRPGRADDPRGGGREARLHPGRHRDRPARRSKRGSMPRTPIATSCPASGGWCATARPRRHGATDCASTDGVRVDDGVYRRRRGLDPLRSDDRQAGHLGRDARRGGRQAGRRARRVSRSRAPATTSISSPR